MWANILIGSYNKARHEIPAISCTANVKYRKKSYMRFFAEIMRRYAEYNHESSLNFTASNHMDCADRL
jgi:hypothetical protein